jgi:hypothetical protein
MPEVTTTVRRRLRDVGPPGKIRGCRGGRTSSSPQRKEISPYRYPTTATVGGNLAVGDGLLIVAHADKPVVYCQTSRLIRRYREAIDRFDLLGAFGTIRGRLVCR